MMAACHFVAPYRPVLSITTSISYKLCSDNRWIPSHRSWMLRMCTATTWRRKASSATSLASMGNLPSTTYSRIQKEDPTFLPWPPCRHRAVRIPGRRGLSVSVPETAVSTRLFPWPRCIRCGSGNTIGLQRHWKASIVIGPRRPFSKKLARSLELCTRYIISNWNCFNMSKVKSV